ncbi:(d)CMP kinase [Aliibacillus thermotolerans]|uniref:Cytidylate kinase n=1 Tax=Aliibacillus thermotolerans TaxID=1834418 RepID=A0ABW0U6E3_9BACI|nr:(d)CMP kinase [Aliibacillus thermotolerans]MDA3129490.1 (d)CMP kinase [Aliibacillus thermotolerans]
MKKINIAIDGPAGAGKSTVARLLASRLGYVYIDTGAMYRALAWKALQRKVDPKNGPALLSLLKEIEIRLLPTERGNQVFVNDTDVTTDIRSNEVTAIVSKISQHQEVRTSMVERQQQLARHKGTVLDGRDIGTAVLPEAELKIFLLATVEERAKRRHEENCQKGIPSDYASILEDIKQRDELDTTRTFSPLVKAKDAIEMDTTNMSIAEVVERMYELAMERIRS